MSEPREDFTLILMEESPLQRFRRVLRGLKAPKDSGEYRYARFEMLRMLGGPVVSVGFGLLVTAALITFAVGEALTKDREVQVEIMTPETVKLDEIKEELQRIDDVVDAPPDANIPQDAVTDVQTPDQQVQDTVASVAPVMTKSPLILKGLYGSLYGNRSAGGRAGALRAYKGSQAGEDAVMRALRWLKANQQPDGSWIGVDTLDPVAMAGLALLCFLAHNETPSSPEFGPTVEKAMKYLIGKQQQNGCFGREYTHGIVAYAMSEGYALTKVMALKESMDKGIQYIIDGQQPQGGFNYGYSKADRFDLSVSGWQFQALKAAKMAGCGNERLEEAITKGVEFLKRQAFNATAGGFVYADKPGQPPTTGPVWTMTGAGTLCLQLLGHGKSPEVKAGVKFLEVVKFVWPEAPTAEEKARYAAFDERAKEVEKEIAKAGDAAAKAAAEEKAQQARQAAQAKSPKRAPVYGWYYVTQAKFQEGGGTWEDWNRQFAKELIRAQYKDGHWEHGDWSGGPVYTTTLCTLMLEVYYRYLPTYKKAEDAPDVKAISEKDVEVDVS
jgi:hypothetical protein